MNWYRKSQLKKIAEKTLYHGTSIDHMESINRFGLEPRVGEFVRWGYDEYEEAGIKLPELVFATDKGDLRKAVTAMRQAVAVMLGKKFHEVNSRELQRYGLLVIIPGEQGSAEGAHGFQRRSPDSDTEWERYYSQDYPTVEPGDYFSENFIHPVKMLIGEKMIRFLNKTVPKIF